MVIFFAYAVFREEDGASLHFLRKGVLWICGIIELHVSVKKGKGAAMSQIIELPEVLANQIAAGEVIERPASVVKELVENSIDAGASQIVVEIEEAGLKSIRITDNGEGIAHDEVALALCRHATSKIKNQADLFRIRTLGFRGEAMPSIASVSILTLLTAQEGAAHGTKLVAKGGEIEELEPATSPVGTKITVEDLFFNTPARLKEVTGFVSLPELTRANRNYISLFINGRYIKNFLLNRAILDGYGSKLMVGRFPLAIINIQIDPYLADVNVHPTKQEVRISKERELMALISQAIANALKEQDLIPDALENLAKSTIRRTEKPVQTTLPLKENRLYYDRESQDFKLRPEVADPQLPLADETATEARIQENPVEKPTSAIKFAERKTVVYDELDHPELDLASLDKAYDKLDGEEHSTFPELEYFGQMHGTYLFAQGNGGLYIIDQHAAQERVKYEEYRESIGDVDGSQQQLLVPYIFEFPTDDLIRLQQRKHLLEEVGVYLEEYGANQLILREHPIWMKEEEIESGIYEMCDMLLLTKEVSIKKYRAELAIMMSCKRSIKANHTLDDYSARDLIYQLSQCDNPYNCPHGRPVLVNFTKSDMEKMFRRIQENHTSLRELGKY